MRVMFICMEYRYGSPCQEDLFYVTNSTKTRGVISITDPYLCDSVVTLQTLMMHRKGGLSWQVVVFVDGCLT